MLLLANSSSSVLPRLKIYTYHKYEVPDKYMINDESEIHDKYENKATLGLRFPYSQKDSVSN